MESALILYNSWKNFESMNKSIFFDAFFPLLDLVFSVCDFKKLHSGEKMEKISNF
jgi:hypothetical protein